MPHDSWFVPENQGLKNARQGLCRASSSAPATAVFLLPHDTSLCKKKKQGQSGGQALCYHTSQVTVTDQALAKHGGQWGASLFYILYIPFYNHLQLSIPADTVQDLTAGMLLPHQKYDKFHPCSRAQISVMKAVPLSLGLNVPSSRPL